MNVMTTIDGIAVLHTRIVTGTGGGPEKTIFNSPRYMRGTGYRELACYLRPPDDPGFEVLRQRAAAKDCPLIEVDDASAFSLDSLRRLAAICREHDIKIWHGHDYKTNLFGVLLKPFVGFKLVTTVHGWVKHTSKTPLYYAIDRWTLPRHEQVIVVSADLYERCRASGVPEDRLHLIENAIDTEDFRRTGPAAQAAGRIGMPPGRLLIGAVGRLSAEKGFDLLIRAVATLIGEGHDLELWIAGDGEARDELERQAVATGYGDRIRLLGFQADTVALVRELRPVLPVQPARRPAERRAGGDGDGGAGPCDALRRDRGFRARRRRHADGAGRLGRRPGGGLAPADRRRRTAAPAGRRRPRTDRGGVQLPPPHGADGGSLRTALVSAQRRTSAPAAAMPATAARPASVSDRTFPPEVCRR